MLRSIVAGPGPNRPGALLTGALLRAGLVVALGLGSSLGCTKEPPPPTVNPAVTDTVTDNDASFEVKVGWQAVPPDRVKIVIEMRATGIEQTDKLVADVSTSGFVIYEGTKDWSGFILPRERYKHEVVYKLLDGEDSGRATVSIRRSMDGTLLWDTELLFRRTPGGAELAQ